MNSNANLDSKEGASLGSSVCYLRFKSLHLCDPVIDHIDMLPVHQPVYMSFAYGRVLKI